MHLVGFIIEKFVTMHVHMSRCTVTCHDARSHVTMHGHMSRCMVTCHDSLSHVMMHGHMSRCTVTCYDARSHVTMHGHMNVKSVNLFVFICRAFLHLSLKLGIKVKAVPLQAWAVCRFPGSLGFKTFCTFGKWRC